MTDELRVGMTLHPSRVLIEQGPVAVFAAVVDAGDDIHRSAAAARRAGFDGIPVPPTYPFVMGHWGTHPDEQPPPAGDVADLAEISSILRGDGGMMLHGEQGFEYHRPLLVGETVDVSAHIADVGTKVRRDGRTMRMATIVTEVRGADGTVALTASTTLICLV